MKGEKDRPGTPEQVIGRQRADFWPLRKNVETRKKRGLINSVENEMGFNSMPKPHQAEGKEITDDGRDVPVTKPSAPNGRHQKTHVYMVAEPKGKGDVPTVPEVSNIPRQKRAIEIFRCVNAEKVAKGDGKGAVTSEIEKQIEAIGVHIAYQSAESRFRGDTIQPILFDQTGEDELIKESAKDAVHSSIEIADEVIACSPFFPIPLKATVPVNRTGGNSGKEKQEAKEIEQSRRSDDAVAKAKDNIQRAEGDVREAKETKLPKQQDRDDFGQYQRQEAKRHCRVKHQTSTGTAGGVATHRRPLPKSKRNNNPNFTHFRVRADFEFGLILDDQDDQSQQKRPPPVRASEQTENQRWNNRIEEQAKEGEIRVWTHSDSASLRRSTLPFAVSGNASMTTNFRGSM